MARFNRTSKESTADSRANLQRTPARTRHNSRAMANREENINRIRQAIADWQRKLRTQCRLIHAKLRTHLRVAGFRGDAGSAAVGVQRVADSVTDTRKQRSASSRERWQGAAFLKTYHTLRTRINRAQCTTEGKTIQPERHSPHHDVRKHERLSVAEQRAHRVAVPPPQ